MKDKIKKSFSGEQENYPKPNDISEFSSKGLTPRQSLLSDSRNNS